MPDASSAERVVAADPVGGPRALDVPGSARLGMVLLGFIPALHLIATLSPLALAAAGRMRPGVAAWLAPAILFLLPPLLVRAATWRRPLPSGLVEPSDRRFLHWWFSAQCQVIFMRFPMLEEMLRMIPGLYSSWLRLWGARVGGLVYWSPGVVILDRSLVDIGSRVVFGVGARLNPHVLAASGGRGMALYLGPIVIGDDVLVGGYSILLAGCAVAAGEVTPPFRTIHAYSRFANGRRAPADTVMDNAG